MKQLKKQPKWTPFGRATLPPATPQQINGVAEASGIPYEQAAAVMYLLMNSGEVYLNSRYQVHLMYYSQNMKDVDRRENAYWLHLSVKRLDKAPLHDWRDLQRIKNELIGENYEGIELYPAEDRRVDTANQYHIWVVNSPHFRFDVGWPSRLVVEDSHGGAVQREFEL